MQNFIQNPYPPPKPLEHEKFIKPKPTWENQLEKSSNLQPRTSSNNTPIQKTTNNPPSTTPNLPSTNPNPPSTHYQQHRIHLVEAQSESRSTKQYKNDHRSPPRSNPEKPSLFQQKRPPQPPISTHPDQTQNNLALFNKNDHPDHRSPPRPNPEKPSPL